MILVTVYTENQWTAKLTNNVDIDGMLYDVTSHHNLHSRWRTLNRLLQGHQPYAICDYYLSLAHV